MTYRLVGLMSFVLLLCLGVFGLLLGSYHDDVMQELTHTVSAVGRAALNSFAFRSASEGGAEPRVRHLQIEHFGSDERPTGSVPEGRSDSSVFVFTTDVRAGAESADGGDERATHSENPEAGKVVVLRERLTSRDPHGAEVRHEEIAWTYAVRLDGVQAEGDPARGLLLRIPTFRAPAGDGSAGITGIAGAGDDDQQVREADDIVLPIPTEDYRDAFSSVRRRSLLLFLGVFVVGTFLSAGLAARFTSPIRRLDRGIRRIAAGDLDAEVEVRGKDEIARLSSAFNDMTRELRASRERSRELTRREKLSALGRLAAGVAHDVRNPLHSIGLTLQHLQETCRPEAPAQRAEFDHAVGVIRQEVGRLDGLVGNFLRFARTEERERQTVDLVGVLRETSRLVRKEAEWRRIRVEVSVEGEVPSIRADVEAVRSSVLNLVLNAFESMPDGGNVTLTARARDGEVQVEVADEGEGIPEADREKVFEFAYTTRKTGHGMGLAMVHQCVVEEHGGRVTLDSRPGGGTRVLLGFPLGDAVRV